MDQDEEEDYDRDADADAEEADGSEDGSALPRDNSAEFMLTAKHVAIR